MKTIFRKFFWGGWWILLVAMGCQRGCSCTTSRVIETESETRQIEGVPFEIEVEKVRTKHMRFFARVPQKSYFTYAVSYNLKVAKRPWVKGTFGLPADKSTDLNEMLRVVNFKFSKDKKHFAVYEEGELILVFHLLKEGVPFTANEDLRNAFKAGNALPTPEQIAMEIIKKANAQIDKNELLIEALSAQSVPSTFDDALLEVFPKNEMLTDVLKLNNRLDKLTKTDEKWLKRIHEKLIAYYKSSLEVDDATFSRESATNYAARHVSNMMVFLGDKAPTKELDDLMLADFPAKPASVSYYEARKEVAIDPSLQNKINQNILATFNNPKSKIKSYNSAFDYVFSTKNYPLRKSTLEVMLKPQNMTHLGALLNFEVFSSTGLNKFTNDEKKLIIDICTNLLLNKQVDSSSHQRTLFRFLRENQTCDVLKKIKAVYPNEIAMRLPSECEGSNL